LLNFKPEPGRRSASASRIKHEEDIYTPVHEGILIVDNDISELLNNERHELVIIRIPPCDVLVACSGPRPESGPSGSRLSIMGLQATSACGADPVRDKELHSPTISRLIRRM
jgi:hypothetical protein